MIDEAGAEPPDAGTACVGLESADTGVVAAVAAAATPGGAAVARVAGGLLSGETETACPSLPVAAAGGDAAAGCC